MRYQGIVLGDTPDYLEEMNVFTSTRLDVIELGFYKKATIDATIFWTYDYWTTLEETTVQSLIEKGDFDYPALAWPEPMWHKFWTHSTAPGIIIKPSGYNEIYIKLPYSYQEDPGVEKVKRELFRARNYPDKSKKAWIVGFHS